MRTLSFLAAVLLVLGLCAWAQDSKQVSRATDQSFSGKQVTLQGCLTGSRGHYTLTTNKDNLYQLKGDQNFHDYFGKYVKLSGVEGQPERDTPRNPNAIKSVLSTAPPLVDVTILKALYGTCQ